MIKITNKNKNKNKIEIMNIESTKEEGCLKGCDKIFNNYFTDNLQEISEDCNAHFNISFQAQADPNEGMAKVGTIIHEKVDEMIK